MLYEEFKKDVESAPENRKIGRKTKDSSSNEPIKDGIMRAIEPGLLLPHARIEILGKYNRKIFRAPAEYGALFKRLERHIPNIKARLGGIVSKRDIAKPP